MIWNEPKKGKRSRYSSNSAYIRGVWNANKKYITKKVLEWEEGGGTFGESSDPIFQRFKAAVKGYMDMGYSPEKAVRSVGLMKVFSSKKENYLQFVYEQLKEYKSTYKEFRELSKEHGRYTKFDAEKLRYAGDNTYIYNNMVRISFEYPDNIRVRKENRRWELKVYAI